MVRTYFKVPQCFLTPAFSSWSLSTIKYEELTGLDQLRTPPWYTLAMGEGSGPRSPGFLLMKWGGHQWAWLELAYVTTDFFFFPLFVLFPRSMMVIVSPGIQENFLILLLTSAEALDTKSCFWVFPFVQWTWGGVWGVGGGSNCSDEHKITSNSKIVSI